IAGVTGATLSGLTACYNTGSVRCEGTTNNYLGGLIGTMGAGSSSAHQVISDCYNTGDVTVESTASTTYASGLVGSAGSYTELTRCYNTGNITGMGRVAGIVFSLPATGTVRNCYNTGDLTVVEGLPSLPYIAGIAMVSGDGATVENCYSMGDITPNGVALTNVSGIVAGGTVAAPQSRLNTAIVTDCYYLTQDDMVFADAEKSGVTGLTLDAFTGGAAAFRLDMESATGNRRLVWSQSTETDGDGATWPVLADDVHTPVYQATLSGLTGPGSLTVGTISPISAAGETGYFRAGESLTVTATPEGAAVLQSLTAFNQRSGQLLYSTSKQTGMAVPTPTDAICVYAAFAEVPGGSVQVTLHSTEGYFTDAATEKTYTIPAGMTIQEYFDGLEEAVPEPVRDPVGEDEYFFRGWYSTETRSHPTDYFAVDAVLVEDTDLYAGWSIKGTVDVNYNLGLLNDKAAADGSVLSVPSTVSAKVGALAVPPTGADVWADWATYYNEETERFEFPIVLAEDGTVLLCYVLTGWTTSEVQSKRLTQSGDVFWNFETDIIPLETDTDTGITLYACWSMVSPQFEQGAGVPYEITEVNDFLWMAAISEQGYDFTGDSFTLGNDIDLSDTEWEASILYFNGALDGEEYTITLPGDLEMPLFNELGSAAVIEDLRLAGDITTSYVSREWSVLALYNEGALSNISADLTLNLTPLKYLGGSDVNAIDVTYVGGLVYANEQAGEIDDCTVALDFTWSWSSGNGSYVTTFYVGGIACQNAGTITACKTEGSGIDLVDCSCVTIKVGGIVNSNEETGTISGCVNGMDILLPTSSTASGSYSGYIGGIAVSNAGAVTECTNLGKISSARSYIGGIVASMTGGTLTGCTNGDETDKTRGEVTGFYTVGGIIGKLSGNGSDITAEDLINYGTISNSIFSTGSVADVGGLIGQVQGTSGDEITLSSSENHGAVSHQYGSDAGGLVGDSSYLAISGCDNRGDIYFSPAYASRNDFSNKGGLVGYASYTTAEGCNNYGNIYAEEAGRWVAAGGLIGSATGGGASGETALSNCENYGNIAQTGETTSSSAPTGGLVGTLGAGVSMENCTSYGGITIEGASGTIGGLAGSNAGTITDCKIEESDEVSTEPLIGLTVESAVLRIDLNEETGQYYGGLVGNNTGVIDASSGEGGMVITGGTAEYVGGIAGINGNVSTAADSKITNSKYIGNISVKKGTYVGGVAGHNVGGVIGAEVAAGTSSAQTDVSYTGNITVETGTYIGGLLGANSSYTYQKDDVTELLQSKLSGAVFSGSVTAGGSGSGVGGSYVGGLIGANEGAAANIYGEDIQVAVGSIYMSDAADGTGYLGGLIGYNAVGASLKNSYATGGLSLPDGVDAETAAVGYLIGGNDVEERADVQYNYWYSTQSDDTAVSGIGVNVLADSASNYYGAEGWSESPGYSYSHGMWKSDDAFHSGEVAYYLDGANLAHQGVWTQDEAVGLPAYGDPSYYRVGVDSSSEGGSVTVVYGERSVTNTGALYVPSGGTVTVSVKLAAKTDTYEWNVSNIYMAGSGTEDEIIQTGSVRIPTDKSVTIWAEFYTTPLVKDPDPSPSPSTSAETVQSKSTGGSARSGSGSTINSNGVPGGSGTEPEGSTETGTGAPADQAGNGGDAATTTGTTPMTSQTSTATVDTPTVTVVAPVADVAQIAEGGTVPEAADAAPQSEEENPDEWTDPVEEEIEPEEPVDPEVYVLDRTAADVLAENPAIVALIVAVVAALIVLSVLLNYRRRKHSS
ncbi:MAG: hypothetical protein LIO58_03760, partial [Oscillospiraceae bacterium]|nr:hypothetical protein [Oscillospiraceae bacterium]